MLFCRFLAVSVEWNKTQTSQLFTLADILRHLSINNCSLSLPQAAEIEPIIEPRLTLYRAVVIYDLQPSSLWTASDCRCRRRHLRCSRDIDHIEIRSRRLVEGFPEALHRSPCGLIYQFIFIR